MADWPRPAAVDGLPAPGPIDVLRMVWWTLRGLLHGIGRGPGRATSLLLATGWLAG